MILLPDAIYYFRTVTTSDVTYQPDNTQLPSCTTETKVIRTRSCAEDKTHFSNDLVIFESYLPDSSTPAAGTLVLAEVEGCNYPLSSFVGDGVVAPMTIIDLNNLLSYPGIYTRLSFPAEARVQFAYGGLRFIEMLQNNVINYMFVNEWQTRLIVFKNIIH